MLHGPQNVALPIFLCQDISVFSLANIEVIEIDDFPQPTYESNPFYRRAGPGMTDKEFFLNLWWPGIKEASQKYNIRFTCFATFRYDAEGPCHHLKALNQISGKEVFFMIWQKES